MVLKMTTKRALEFEQRTGKDLLVHLKQVNETGEVRLADVIELFCCLGDGYTVDDYDAWDAPFQEKLKEIYKAAASYFEGGSEKK